MLTVLGGILLGIGIGVLVGMIINFVVLGIRALLERFKKWHEGIVAAADGSKIIGPIIEEELKKNKNNRKTLEDLEKLLNNSIVEAHADDNGKVNPDDIHILKAEKMEDPLRKLLDDNKGLLEVECA